MSNIIPEELRNITEIFTKLSKGYHISKVDYDLYPELCEYQDYYDEIFEKIGFKLSSHSSGFYYFESGKNSINTNGKVMALFIFFFVDFLANKNKDPYSSIIDDSFNIDSLQKDLIERYIDQIKLAGLNNAKSDFFDKAIKQFTQYGFAASEDGILRFKPPITRFLDTCIEIGKVKKQKAESIEEEYYNEQF